ncbi:thiamine-phosphate pyrophosphorylase [Bacillus tianshenii]|uniref:Thiamine-phosphate synthase n=1 Tax=Sutcliffiella tianshenii TaxID=1463404 RepID=A0ABS2P1J7_9BACI|nr:thiamine phosphate synthase [Bacillus tianshenii]MBM7620808.1 thiamine-phosphate pyrophosphorylase [Bacillus tianshenii]
MNKELLKLYLVMGSSNCGSGEPLPVLESALKGGITLFQFREKGNGARSGQGKIKLAHEMMSRCRSYGVPFIVNDDVELALTLEADGVHIGQDDGSIIETRKRFAGKVLGVSVHNVQEAHDAMKFGADYLGVGPMYFTNTKSDLHEVKGPDVIKDIRAAGITLPIVGIGGIDKERAGIVVESGADGVAVISAISQAQCPTAAARELLYEVEKILHITKK